MDDPRIELENLKQARGDYEDHFIEMAPNEKWAEMHGYRHGRCRIHGGFWTDSGDGCPSCEPVIEEQPEQDEDEMIPPDKWLQLTFASWSVRMQQAARETTQGSFFMSAMHRNKVFKP